MIVPLRGGKALYRPAVEGLLVHAGVRLHRVEVRVGVKRCVRILMKNDSVVRAQLLLRPPRRLPERS